MVWINISKCIKNMYIYLKKSSRCVLGWIENGVQNKKKRKTYGRNWKKRGKEISLRNIVKIKRKCATVISGILHICTKISDTLYIQLGKIFDIQTVWHVEHDIYGIQCTLYLIFLTFRYIFHIFWNIRPDNTRKMSVFSSSVIIK